MDCVGDRSRRTVGLKARAAFTVVCGHDQPGSVASDGVAQKKVVTVINTTPTIAAATATGTIASSP
jgi:hypothetical protein